MGTGMDPDSLAEAGKFVGATTVGGGVVAFFARFMVRKMTEESAVAQRAIGEAEIINQLRSEIERMSAVNTAQLVQINEMQQANIKLRGENAELKVEISALKAQARYFQGAGTQ